jgi:hypothetical protein
MRQTILVFTLLLAPSFARADDDARDCRCDHCGCRAHCQKVCRVICEMKDVKTTCYCCKEADVCIPGHSEKCGEVCEPNPCCQARPADCDCDCNAAGHHGFLDCLFGPHTMIKRTQWEPGCPTGMRTVNKLIKYEVTRKVPTYTWKVEYCCNGCCTKMALEEAASGAPSAIPSSASVAQATSGHALSLPDNSQPKPSAVEQASYQSADTAPRHSLPWDKMFQ